jgi:hypothetical protein
MEVERGETNTSSVQGQQDRRKKEVIFHFGFARETGGKPRRNVNRYSLEAKKIALPNVKI